MLKLNIFVWSLENWLRYISIIIKIPQAYPLSVLDARNPVPGRRPSFLEFGMVAFHVESFHPQIHLYLHRL